METLSPLAGKPAPPEMLVDVTKLERAYFDTRPDVEDLNQLVHFGTSGHRGSSLRASFNESHILAITQAICDYRRMQGTTGPLYLGKDTHALSAPAQRTALEVLAANQVETLIQQNDGVTPDASHLASDSRLQPRPKNRFGGWHRRDAFAQSAGGWRFQIQPAARWTSRHTHNQLDRESS
jgi:alpha-D-glucose phosphate-specific phosphoglucomutase